ncbi:ATP-binding protein [Brucella intermedia]|uniref:ATP-binding protein n=1 Tax=Brucella intermedia TaxID=94625 RepID=UPI00209B5182|nr:ATP-binding protein [Brucella intermedia]MCO7727050.1 ATP-binding protein [Brucella intermedia]
MSKDISRKQLFVAVTGAQGVGKSTFCERLRLEVENLIGEPVALLAGLGEQVRSQGIVVGSEATEAGVAAIYAAHMLRERNAPPGIVILDRCAVDAAAYVRGLPSIPWAHRALYHETSWLMSRRLSYVAHLTRTGIFAPTQVVHETEDFRSTIAQSIPGIIQEFGLFSDDLYAADQDAVPVAVSKIIQLWQTRD